MPTDDRVLQIIRVLSINIMITVTSGKKEKISHFQFDKRAKI